MRKILIAFLLLTAVIGKSQCLADFSFATTGSTVQFISSASTSQGTVTAYYWDFGDGTVAAITNPVHFYANPGVYMVRHTIQTSTGCGDTILKMILINPPTLVPVSLCPSSATDSIQSSLTGTTYQWQVSTDSVTYSDLVPGTHYSGTNTRQLKLLNVPSSFTSYRYRCLVDGSADDTIFRLRFVNEWKGTASGNWSNAANWRCGTLPDANTDVVITSGNVVVDVNTTVQSLTVLAPGTITVQVGVTLTVTH